jgi:hypothetical protein
MGIGGAGCSGALDAPEVIGPSAVSAAYLDQVVEIMRANSINRLRIDWAAFDASVDRAASNAQTVADTYPAILVALRLLNDGHSSFHTREGNFLFVPIRNCTAPSAARPVLPSNIGYVRVRWFSGVRQLHPAGRDDRRRGAMALRAVTWILTGQ